MAKKHKKTSNVVVQNEILTPGVKQHLKYLVQLSFLFKLVIFLITTFIFNSYMDLYLTNYYYEHILTNFVGNFTYINYYYEYPILSFVPVAIAVIPSLLLNSYTVYVLLFSLLMIICDCITAICIYLIVKKIWNDSKRAFISAAVYTTAISTAYFAMVDNASLPTCLLMISLTLLIYEKEISDKYKVGEYLALICGYFTKVFPIIALPFIIFHKSKTTSLKQEIISALKVVIPVSALLILPTFIFNPASTFKTYVPMRMDIGYFPETIIWTIFVWLHDVFSMGITTEMVLYGVYACMGIGILSLVYSAYAYKKQDPIVLIKFILCGILLVVLSFKVRSPTYVIWFTSLVCILIGDNIYKIGLFYITQILGYIEYPLSFWKLWTNVGYTNPIHSMNWYMALIMFTLLFASLIALTWVSIEPVKLYNQIFKDT